MSAEQRNRAPARVAIYWVPPAESELVRLGAAWLGRDVASERCFHRPAIHGFTEDELAAITAEPRRYGLHATLKAPFRLAEGCGVAALEEELRAFAGRAAPEIIPALRAARIGRFLALVPSAPEPGIAALAKSLVERFDRYRAPSLPEEVVRRAAVGLTRAQDANLRRWGYPYVMDEYRFHVTLTGPVESAVAERLLPLLARFFAPVTRAPLNLSEVVLVAEPVPGAPFRLLRRFSLEAAS